MIAIGIQTSEFPFNLMDVAMLLRLTIRRRSPDYAYAECPLCGDRRGKLCLNLKKNVWYSNCCGEHGGMLALYAQVQRTSTSEAFREICEELQTGNFAPDYKIGATGTTPKPPITTVERASPQEIHQTYSAFLSMLSLTPGHLKHLQMVRGLSAEQIHRFGFKSTPPPSLCRTIARKLMEQGHTLEGVPGFYINDSGKWTIRIFKRTSGILIPYVGAGGLIQGLQTRLDVPIRDQNAPADKVGTKYLWLASADKNKGVSSGSPIHFIGDPCARVVYVTEGALKADIVHALTGRTVAATGGVGCTSQLDELFSFLRHNGTEEIIEAQDMDKFSNQGVRRGASKVYLLARKNGLDCRRLTWNPNYKGFDDWLLALRKPQALGKESENMTFKENFLFGRCTLDDMDKYIEQWHLQQEGNDEELSEYLGLTHEEYAVYLQMDVSVKFEELMESQRRRQQFRVYQLDLSKDKVVPFAFRGLSALQKAGFQQPPAAKYRLVYEGEIICPVLLDEPSILQQIFQQCNVDFPEGYSGHSLSPSDVVELYEDGQRRYFYRDDSKFVSVSFSPALASPKEKDGFDCTNG